MLNETGGLLKKLFPYLISSPFPPFECTCVTHLNQEEMNPKCGETSGQLDILDFGIDLGDAGQLLVFLEDLLLNLVGLHVRLGKKFSQAEKVNRKAQGLFC